MRVNCIMLNMLTMLSMMSLTVTQSDIMPIGGRGGDDVHNCLISAGYSWCASTNSCIRQWDTPCEDNYNDCSDCLKRQRNGENIACPTNCDTVVINDPCSLGCPPPVPCPAPPQTPNCEHIPPQQDNCGCNVGCGTIRCTPIPPPPPPPYPPATRPRISQVGETCGGYMPQNMVHICAPNLECIYTMGPMIADAPGTCQPNCLTVRDEWGNCVDENCLEWSDGCNTCNVITNGLTKELNGCTEQVCYQNTLGSHCVRYNGKLNDQLNQLNRNIPNNCATWFDGCNTCSVVNGRANLCTLMYCFRQEEPYCMSITTDALRENDLCYRFCEDSSQSEINRLNECPKDTRCVSSLELNQVSMIAFDNCGPRAKQCLAVSGH